MRNWRGGLKTGQVIGSTDRGHEVMENKIEIPDLHTTIAMAMGMPVKEIVMSESKKTIQRRIQRKNYFGVNLVRIILFLCCVMLSSYGSIFLCWFYEK